MKNIEYFDKNKPQFREHGNRETGAAETVFVAAYDMNTLVFDVYKSLGIIFIILSIVRYIFADIFWIKVFM